MSLSLLVSAPRLPAAGTLIFACTALWLAVIPALRAADADSTGGGAAANPLLEPSTLPLGYPQFDRIKSGDFLPAFDVTMAEELKQVDAIANNPAAPTFDNTLVALEKSGLRYQRVQAIFSNLVGANGDDALRAVEKTMAPKMAAHADAIELNGKLFARIEAVYEQRDRLGLDPESKHLVERYYKDFVRAGAKLGEADKERLKQMNQRIAALETEFAQNVQNESNAEAIVVSDRAELAGMSPDEIAATEAAAKETHHDGKYVIALMNTSGQPALASLENRALRERIEQASLARCSHGGPYDNRAVVAELARLRADRAALLGYRTYADYFLDDETAGSVATVNKLLADLARPAVANARREAADMQALIDAGHGGFKLAAWDWDFYAEKVRKARYDFDESQLKPYFELNHVLFDGVFYAAHQLYGLTFKERHDLPVYEPTVRVFDVFDANGAPLAIFIADYFARPAKRGGAWMNSYVDQSTLLGRKAIVANHLNIPQPPPGQPALLTFDEVTTMFHEFGHALHGMLSDVRYPRFSGTDVPRDFVEFPSQVNEMWAVWPEVVKHYARHYQTGAAMPQELLEKMLATRKFNQGFMTTEYLAASLLDQAWHQLTPDQVPNADGVVAFEAAALHRAGVDFPPVPPRYRSTYFLHIFNNDFSAGYYSYIWAEVLDADSVEWFKTHGGLTRANGDHFRQTLLSRGGTDDAMKLFHAFTGRDPYIEPLLERRGLVTAPAK
ncbi:MAG TPA: M3 family metallopeptidase [Opitutaceae bacterium]|nr:M3 family metallopeptidase [Opitutaceae bacterium]